MGLMPNPVMLVPAPFPACPRGVVAGLGACAILTLAVGCHQGRFSSTPLPADGEELPILHKVHGVHSHETRPMQLVIRDAAAYAQLALADVPVDFEHEMMLVVTLGRVTSDQYLVDVARVWRERGQLRVETHVVAPPPGVPTVMSSPYCIAVVPRCDLNVAEFSVEPPVRTRSWQQSEPPSNLTR